MKNSQIKKALENAVTDATEELKQATENKTPERCPLIVSNIICRLAGIIDMIEEEDVQYPPYIPPYIPPYGDQTKDYKLKTDDKAGGEG